MPGEIAVFMGFGALVLVTLGGLGHYAERIAERRPGMVGAIGAMAMAAILAVSLAVNLAGIGPHFRDQECIGPPSESC